jgi:hypothetical protein
VARLGPGDVGGRGYPAGFDDALPVIGRTLVRSSLPPPRVRGAERVLRVRLGLFRVAMVTGAVIAATGSVTGVTMVVPRSPRGRIFRFGKAVVARAEAAAFVASPCALHQSQIDQAVDDADHPGPRAAELAGDGALAGPADAVGVGMDGQDGEHGDLVRSHLGMLDPGGAHDPVATSLGSPHVEDPFGRVCRDRDGHKTTHSRNRVIPLGRRLACV